MPVKFSASEAIGLGRQVLETEAASLSQLSAQLDESFAAAVELLLSCRGRVVVTGIGKSGHIAGKLAATLASTGTPAFFVHAAEAAHGDLGMVTPDDVVIGISYSGETKEVLTIVPTIKREGARLISITGNPASHLARYADVSLNAHVDREACPLNLAPTNSTTATLALGDALAIACMSAKQFKAEDFARSHPGGSLGRLLAHVSDIMRTGEAVPSVPAGTPVMKAVEEITHKRIGMTAILTPQGQVCGIFTEGDLRRLIGRVGDIRSLVIDDVMTRNPYTVSSEALAAEAAHIMQEHKINQLLVTDPDGHLTGALHVQDMMAAKVL